MKRWEREKILGEWGVREGSAVSEAERGALERDLEGHPHAGKRIRQRLRNFTVGADSYIKALHGPLPYMQRLREIHDLPDIHERRLAEAWAALADECRGDATAFERRWRATAARWSFYEVNDLIERHNRFYPAEARLPMDPRTRDYALVNGEPYRREPLGASWILRRFPPRLSAVPAC